MRISMLAARLATLVGAVSFSAIALSAPGCSNTCGGCCNDMDCAEGRVCNDNKCSDSTKAAGKDGRDGVDGKDGDDGKNGPDGGEYIVGGEITRAFAATGALLAYGRPICTGTLVGPTKVLTAAHCLAGATLPSLAFGIGSSAGSSPTVQVEIASASVHPQYLHNGQRPVAYDLAVLNLARAVTEVVPSVITSDAATGFVGKQMTLIGYGADADGVTGAGIRKLARVTVQGVSAQSLDYSYAGMGACKGDSGGPAFVEKAGAMVQVGVTSWGSVPCLADGHYQRLDVATAWLQQQGVVPVPPPPSCVEDGTCQGGCEDDKDCWTVMCPSGHCSVPTGRCAKDEKCDSQCGSADPDCSGFTDTCQQYGLYGNGRCDQNCPKRDPDCVPQTPQTPPSGGYCCDGFGYRRCILQSPAPLGTNCFCYGQGYGYTCL